MEAERTEAAPRAETASFEEILESGQPLVYTNVGDSMEPLIRQGRDLLVIRKNDREWRKYDIPLYRRDNGQYVLHRILKVRVEIRETDAADLSVNAAETAAEEALDDGAAENTAKDPLPGDAPEDAPEGGEA